MTRKEEASRNLAERHTALHISLLSLKWLKEKLGENAALVIDYRKEIVAAAKQYFETAQKEFHESGAYDDLIKEFDKINK